MERKSPAEEVIEIVRGFNAAFEIALDIGLTLASNGAFWACVFVVGLLGIAHKVLG